MWESLKTRLSLLETQNRSTCAITRYIGPGVLQEPLLQGPDGWHRPLKPTLDVSLSLAAMLLSPHWLQNL